MTAPRIVLDINVLISAIVFGGGPHEVLEKRNKEQDARPPI